MLNKKEQVTISVDCHIPNRWYTNYGSEEPDLRARYQLPSGCLIPEATGELRHVPKF